jgi:hypothetical protein
MADPLDSATRLLDDLGQGRRNKVGQLRGREAGPQPSTGFNSDASTPRRSTTSLRLLGQG